MQKAHLAVLYFNRLTLFILFIYLFFSFFSQLFLLTAKPLSSVLLVVEIYSLLEVPPSCETRSHQYLWTMTAELLQQVSDPASHFPLWYSLREGEDSATVATENKLTAWMSKSGKNWRKKRHREEMKTCLFGLCPSSSALLSTSFTSSVPDPKTHGVSTYKQYDGDCTILLC